MTTFLELKEEGIKRFGKAGAWVYDEWKKLNDTFFHGNNKVGPIVWGLTIQGESLGYYKAAENLIYLHRHLLRPIYPRNDLTWDVRYMNKNLSSDVLLHEMIHQRIHQTGGWVGETSHNNVRFVEEVNRISKMLGLGVKARVIEKNISQDKVRKQAKPDYLTIRELFYFPYASRHSSYYHRGR